MEKQIQQVIEFHKTYGRPIHDGDFIPLRADLQMEEAKELKEAIEKQDYVAIADAVIDSLYVSIGTAIHFGFEEKLEELFDAVHRSNMSKVDPTTGKPIIRADGKVLKGSNYMPPTKDIKNILQDNCPRCGLSKEDCKKACATIEFQDGLD